MAQRTGTSTLLSLAEMPELIGRTLYSFEDDNVYAGPITAITVEDGDLLVITTEWTAIASNEYGPWRDAPNAPNRISTRDSFGYANERTDGSFTLNLPYIGSATIDGPNDTPFRRPV